MNYRNIIALFACSLAFAALDAKAEGLKPTAFGLHLHSAHFPAKDSHENRNRGLYVRGESYQAGVYANSLGRTSPYAAYVHKFGPLDLLIGVVGGYQKRCSESIVRTGKKDIATETTRSVSKTPQQTYGNVSYCSGFGRGYLNPMAGFSITSPVSFSGAKPVLFIAPGFGKTQSVAHLAIEFKF